MSSGLLLVQKPSGITSFDVIRKVRKKLNIRKIGHSGTLDPFASGLILLAVKEGTKALSELLLEKKEYVADIIFGATSDTDDRDGTIQTKENVIEFSEEKLGEVLKQFHGEREQTPPQYSALKIRGKRACDRVRKGENIEEEIQAKRRTIYIYEMELLDFQFPKAKIRISCSTGTYIRSLARELGELLNMGAYVSELLRTKIGDFSLDDAQIIEDISEKDIFPIHPKIFPFPGKEISESEEEKIRHGIAISSSDSLELGKIGLYNNGKIIAFAEVLLKEGKKWIQPKKIFNLEEFE